MQQVTTSPDRTRRLIDSIASHLRDPGFGWVSGNTGSGCVSALARCRGASNVSDCLIGELMAEIGQSAGNAIVTPAFVLLGHAEDQRFKFRADGRTSRGPQGFVDNFAPRVGGGVVPDDVIGRYDGKDLAFYQFLADNYLYREQYYSSHPGPTLPNRMYALAGDLQYDRVGEAIVNNNSGDSLGLSRSLNIFDILTRKGVPWRVYESFPSLAMLRMFARYVGDNTNIVPIVNLQADIAASALPPITFIEPAMHHPPENDDHPPADMLYGQIFFKYIYDGLRANEPRWRRTLLIISYDEHGGFYGHVVPPVAEIRWVPLGKASAPVDFKAALTTPTEFARLLS